MKRSMATKIVSLLLALMMIANLTACGGENSETTTESETEVGTSSNQTQEEVSTEAPKTWTDDDEAEITIMMAGTQTPEDDNIVIQALEEATGTKINIIYVSSGGYAEKLNARIADNDLPDLFWVSTLSLASELKEAGMIADMEDVLNAVAPNYIEETKELLHKPAVNEDGAYLLMNSSQDYGVNVCIRTDWLKNLGLNMPTNLDEFADVMHAFTYDDPDQDGVDDTFGYSFNLNSLNGDGRNGQNLFGAFGIPKGQNIELEDGTVTTWTKHPRFLEAVRYIKGLIEDGVCEPDYVSIPQLNMFEKLWTGTSGCLEWECVGPTNNWMPGRYVEQDPLPEFGFAVLEGPYGDCGTSAAVASVTEGWLVSADCENMEGVARIANYLMSEEGSNLLILGVEGVMYEWVDKENGEVKYLEPYNDSATHRAAGGFCYVKLFKSKNNAEVRTLNKQTQGGVELAWSLGIDYVINTEVSTVYTEYGADMSQILKEMFAELLITEDDKLEEVYNDYIAQWEEAGGSDWEKEVTGFWQDAKNK